MLDVNILHAELKRARVACVDWRTSILIGHFLVYLFGPPRLSSFLDPEEFLRAKQVYDCLLAIFIQNVGISVLLA